MTNSYQMSIGSKASQIICSSGYSINYLYDLHLKASRGDSAAREQIGALIKKNRELSHVFYTFQSAAQRVQDARRATRKLKQKAKSTDPRNGSWERLTARVRKSPGLALQGGLPGLGKGSR